LKEALKGNDKELIEAKTKDLTDASAKMSEKLYAQQGAQQPGADAGHQHQAGGAEHASGQKPGGDNVVDAEYEEVKDDKK
jgi:molecular chaperone DnaK